MKRILSSILLCLFTFSAWAQQGNELMSLADRLERFGREIPQEKVFLHMDNTCYFLGDTIWFSAYTRQTNADKPSSLSNVLYVELFNEDGYLVERKLIEMKQGHGSGFFALSQPLMYSGFYELRAYTRWQLNWGCFEHQHSHASKDWFLNKDTTIIGAYDDIVQPLVVDDDFDYVLFTDCIKEVSSVQSLSHVQLFVTPWTSASQASLFITNSRSLLKLMSIKLMMPSSHLILCHPLLLLPPNPPSIRVFSN